MATVKLNLTFQKETKESIIEQANKKGMKISAYIKYLHDKEILENQKIQLAKQLGIYEEIEKTVIEKLLERSKEISKWEK